MNEVASFVSAVWQRRERNHWRNRETNTQPEKLKRTGQKNKKSSGVRQFECPEDRKERESVPGRCQKT